jgi:hypothetical protein
MVDHMEVILTRVLDCMNILSTKRYSLSPLFLLDYYYEET